MRIRVLLLVSVMAFTGCATHNLKTWLGRPEGALIAQQGLPDQQMTTDTGKIYQYRHCFLNQIADDQVLNQCSKTLYYIRDGLITRVERKRG